jgi:hypothetical protein
LKYIYIYTYKTKQIQFNYNTKHTTSITKPREKKNTNHYKTTNKGSELINPIKKIKIKTTILVITHTTKSTNQIKEQKRKKNYISYTNHHRSTGGKKNFERSITNCWGNG